MHVSISMYTTCIQFKQLSYNSYTNVIHSYKPGYNFVHTVCIYSNSMHFTQATRFTNLMLGSVSIKRSISPVSDDSTSSQLM